MNQNATIRGTDPFFDYPTEKRELLMQITGASLAYGMIRETVANLTARGPHGTYLLSSVSFLETKGKSVKSTAK